MDRPSTRKVSVRSHGQNTHADAEVRILGRVADAMGPEQYKRFIDGQTSLSYRPGRLDVTVPDGFMRDLIDRRFGPVLQEAAESEDAAGSVEVRFRVDDKGFAGRGAHGRAEETNGAARAVRRPRRRLKYRLEEYVVGASNKLAMSAAERIAAAEEPDPFSPMFVHGMCGVGKTHLLQGTAQRHLDLFPGGRVKYTTGEAFTNAFLEALREKKIDAFRREHRGLDLLCIDDVHFFSNKEQTQHELLHTVEAACLSGTRLVLASDEHPRDIAQMSKQLASRFVSGAVVRIDPPDAGLRRDLVLRFAARRGLALEDAAVDLLVERSMHGPDASVRALEGMITQIEAVCRLLPELRGDGKIGLTLIGRAFGLSDQGNDTGITRPIRLDEIVAEVCRSLSVEIDQLVGRGRHKRVVLAREMITLLARRLTTASFPEISRALGRPSHSTVVTAHKRVLGYIERNDRVAAGAGFDGTLFCELADRFEHDVRRGARSW